MKTTLVVINLKIKVMYVNIAPKDKEYFQRTLKKYNQQI